MSAQRNFNVELIQEVFSLPANFSRSIYADIICNEYTDVTKVHGFVQNKMGLAMTKVRGLEDGPYKNEQIRLEKFEKLYDPKAHAFRTTHQLAGHKYGRVIPDRGLSLSVMKRGVRQALGMGNYVDIDMRKAQPTILFEKLTQAGLPCAYLGQYIRGDSQVIDHLMAHHQCSKDRAKELILSLINGGTFKAWVKTNAITTHADETIPFITSLIPELKTALEAVFIAQQPLVEAVLHYNPNQWKTLIEKKRGCFGLYFQTVERLLQEECIQHISSKYKIRINDIIPCQDGFLVPIGKYVEGMVESINQFTRDETSIPLTFVVKPFNEAIDIPCVDLEVCQVADCRTFEYLSNEFETQHCNIINRGIYMKETDGEFIAMSRAHIHSAYSHLTYDTLREGKIVSSNFINAWLTSNPDQRNYEDMGIYPNPSRCPRNHLNLWIPFAFHDMGDEDVYMGVQPEVDRLLNHIRILCNGAEDVFDYLVKWIAQMVQYPEVKTICPVLISKQGAGKGTLIRLLERLLGARKVMTSSTPSRDVWGDFNGAMSTSFLVNLDELSKKDTVESAGHIKSLITEPTIMINNKGMNQYPVASYHRFIITTNKEDPIQTSDDDRRNFIIRASDELIGNKQYFNEMYALISDDNVVRAFGEYLLAVPEMHRFSELAMPRTDYQSELVASSRPPIEAWLIDYCCTEPEAVRNVITGDLFADYCVWCAGNRISHTVNSIKFGLSLSTLKTPGLSKGPRKTKGASWDVDSRAILAHFKVETPEITDSESMDLDESGMYGCMDV